MEIGRLYVKLAGRDAGRIAVVVDIDDKSVLIDGNVRRRKCNPSHLEPLDKVIKIKKGASHKDVESEFKKLKLDVWNTKAKKAGPRPRQQRKVKAPKEEKPKEAKPAPKKEEKKEEKPKKETKKPAAKKKTPVKSA